MKLKRIAPKKAEKQETLNELADSIIGAEKAKALKQSTPLRRVIAYRAIDSERDYQDRKWGNTLSGERPGDGYRSVDEYVTYICGYANELLHHASHYADEQQKLNLIRKVAGLCVACMEQHGAPLREG